MIKDKLRFYKFKIILLGILVLTIAFFISMLLETAYVENEKNNLNTKYQTTTPIPTAIIRKRTSYNFEKILSKEFLVFENKEIGFRIKYPLESDPYIYNEQQAKGKFMSVVGEHAIGGVALSLVSQPQDVQTELYDGMAIEIAYYKNSKSRTLEQVIQEQTKNYDIKTGFGTRMEGTLTINANKGAKMIECCFGGKTEIYYFLTKGEKYFIKVVVFTAGEDERQFEIIAERIITSL